MNCWLNIDGEQMRVCRERKKSNINIPIRPFLLSAIGHLKPFILLEVS